MNPLCMLRLVWLSVLFPVAFTLYGADLLIVTPSGMKAEAESLASLHRAAQGMEVEVVIDTEIAPVADSEAIKAYVRKCHEKGLKYLLIIGEGYGDEHSDAWYGMMSETSGSKEWFTVPDIAVGRIPATIPSQFADYIVKVEKYLAESTSRYSRDILIACDNGDGNEHLEQAERLAEEFPRSTVHKAYVGLERLVEGRAPIMHGRFAAALRDGVDLMMYVGHGDPTSITGEGLWNASEASAIRQSHFPWAFFSSCDINAFRHFETTLAEAMIYNRDGGAIGVIGATEVVYSSYNQRIALSFLDKRNAATATMPVGDLWLATQRECIADARRTLNSVYGKNVLAYVFTGDPALPYHVAELSVECRVPESVRPGERFDICGEIVSADGSRHDGTAEIIVYAPAREMPVLDGGDKDKMVVCNDEVLWRGMAKVKESRFSGKIMLPHAEPGKIRIAVHFLSDDRKQGSGMTGDIALLPDAGGKYMDEIEPTVYIHYADGLIVAEVSDDDSGVNSASGMFGASPVLTVDGGMCLPLRTECTGENVVRFTASTAMLAPGTHEAFLSVADNAGNRVKESLTFTILGGKPVINLMFSDEPARESVEFSWSHNMTCDVDITLLVTDMTGETVLYETISGNDRYEWSLEGVAAGIYLVRLLATDGSCHIAAQPRRLTVIR